MDKTVSVAEAKNKLPAIIHEVEQGAMVKITRHGKAVAVVVPQDYYEQKMENGRDFWESLGSFQHQLSSEGITFTDEDFMDLRESTTGRPFTWNL